MADMTPDKFELLQGFMTDTEEKNAVKQLIEYTRLLEQKNKQIRALKRAIADGNINCIIPSAKKIQRNKHGQKVLTMNEAIDVVKTVIGEL